jgi:hypothetical protein
MRIEESYIIFLAIRSTVFLTLHVPANVSWFSTSHLLTKLFPSPCESGTDYLVGVERLRRPEKKDSDPIKISVTESQKDLLFAGPGTSWK